MRLIDVLFESIIGHERTVSILVGFVVKGFVFYFRRGSSFAVMVRQAHHERGKQDGWRGLLLPLWFDGLTTNGETQARSERQASSPAMKKWLRAFALGCDADSNV
ncbi:MAG: hypothetical protein EAZ37_00270 [Burkholderiales bacterium]|nr:MAG: hypothetical protein EAZ37_00270 [Burkholderiales bacterium]